jgi:2-hydroxychromene-2-carboxylate isomerase
MSDTEAIRFYFSFRSPYAWLAAERLDRELGDLGVEIETIPIFPIRGHFPNDPSAIHQKVAFLVQDVRRLARELNLGVQFLSVPDCDWSLSHAAVLGPEQRGADGELIL